MNPILPLARVLWVGPRVPEPARLEPELNGDGPDRDLELCFEPAETIAEVLARQDLGRCEAIVIDQDVVPDPPAQWLCQLGEACGGAEIIVLADAATPLPVICAWVNGAPRLRLLLKPFDPAQLRQLLSQTTLARPDSEAPEGGGELSPSLHLELARLTRQATIDQLTGLLRREEMVRRTNDELTRALRTGDHVVCIMGDIDHFKRVNDVFGHQTGDRTLQTVAAILAKQCRPYDLAGRMGGEEFMLIMPGPVIEDGLHIAERLRLAVQNFPWQEESLPNVTMSFGLAELQGGAYANFEALSNAADAALYEAKRNGRNQVRSARPRTVDEVVAEVTPTEDHRARVLLVDDAPIYLNDLRDLLYTRYRVDATTDPREALAWAERRSYELIITDENMPEIKGHQLLARMKCLQPRCMRIIMASHLELVSVIQAINEGEVYRYVLKPWHDDEILLIIHQALEYQTMAERLRSSDRDTIKALANTIELKDRSTNGHYHRVAELSLLIAAEMNYSRERLQTLEYAAWLHDVGKVGIPDAILKKRTTLTSQEEKIVREHPQLGANLVASIDHLGPIAPLIRHHHERYDGRGYPDGLIGAAIPEEARILCIANAFDGLRVPRGGRHPLEPQSAVEQMMLGRGAQFDPVLLDIFERICQSKANQLPRVPERGQ